jgi:hypothetical protein
LYNLRLSQRVSKLIDYISFDVDSATERAVREHPFSMGIHDVGLGKLASL